MAQQGRRKQAPAYSADTMALRYIAGLALAALGVMIFMAVDLHMSGTIFQGLRQVCFGVSGSMAYVLAALPLWAGGLVIWSTQRRAPVKPWVFTLLAFVGICTFIMLISGNAMQTLDKRAAGNWGGVISTVYGDCISLLEKGGNAFGGGALGVILGWPLWKLLGTVLSVIIIFLLTAFCILLAVNLTPTRIRDLVTGQAGARKQQQEQERILAEQQQMAWQQQQAMQQQAWQQQQARILEQQQAAWQQQNQQPQQPVQQPAQQQAQYSVEQWQQQQALQQTAAAVPAGHKSRIFTGRNNAQEVRPGRNWKSRIFGKKEDEYDGLVGEDVPQTAEEPAAPARYTAVGTPIGKPETHWELANGQQEISAARTARAAQPVKPAQTARKASAQEAQENGGDAGYTVETSRPGKQPKPVQTVMPEVEEVPAEPKIPVTQNRDAYRRPESRQAARQEAQPEPRTESRMDNRQDSRAAVAAEPAPERSPRRRNQQAEPAPSAPVRTPAPVKVPAVQQEISRETWSPELNLEPSTKDPHVREEEEWLPTPYNFPPITDLAMPQPKTTDTAGEDEMRSRKLEETLANFRVQAKVMHVTHGPAISRFELELAPGTKVNKVAELEKDIAYGMEATSIRIEAPIPGKSLVGVEVPNRKVETVTLREVLQSEKMQSAKSLLTVALGKDLAGTPIVCDLAKMPHMLIAGQTGSGKSVCINAIINSLLYRAGPDEVKLILVDPKVVELQCYNGIPHLLIPVVNDPHKAAAALAWAVAEMMERYDRFAERRVRNLDGYNAAIKPTEKPMARIVIIIDELADLMMVCKKDVEEYICRLTQLARAAGIHLIWQRSGLPWTLLPD